MTALGLLEALAAALKDEVSQFKFPAQYQSPQPVKIFVQRVANINDGANYPLILVELAGISERVNESFASVLVTVGTHLAAAADFRANFILSEAVREYICRTRLLKSFAISPEFDFGVTESDSREFFFSQFLIEVRMPKPSRSYIEK